MGLLDTIKPTQRNKMLGLLADAVQGVDKFASKPFGYDNPPVNELMQLLGVRDVGTTLDNMSYGGSLGTGSGMTWKPKDETANAAMALAPLVQAAKSAAPIASRLGQDAIQNAMIPRTMNPQTGAVVWHGSPHKFDAFDASKIGTGEGAQAYGHGLYLADARSVAGSYASNLTTKPVMIDGKNADNFLTDPNALRFLKDSNGSLQGARDIAKAEFLHYKKVSPSATMRGYVTDAIKQLDTLDGKSIQGAGNLYKVDLPDEHIAKMLDWDKLMSGQSAAVKKAWQASKKVLPPNAIDDLGGDLSLMYGKDVMPQDFLNTWESFGQKAGGEMALRNAGVPGVRYLDGGSRAGGAGSSNYVVFPGNESMLNILERNGQPMNKISGLLGN